MLDTLAGKKYLSFLDGFSGYNQIQIASEDQEKTTFTCLWGTYDCVEVFMDDFSVYGETF